MLSQVRRESALAASQPSDPRQPLAPSQPSSGPARTHLTSPYPLATCGVIPARPSQPSPAPGHPAPAMPPQPPSGSAPPHSAGPWTLGRCGARPARPRRPCQPSPWTLGPCGANWPSVRSAPARLPSAWTVGVAGARLARWGGLVLRGGTTPVAFPRGRACFWAPALRFCVGCCRGPAQNKFAPSSLSHCRVSRRCCRQATRRFPEPKAEARIPCHAHPTTAHAKINLTESPQIHSLPRSTDKPGPATNALWTTEPVVDNPPPQRIRKIIRRKTPDIQLTEQGRQNAGVNRSLWTTRPLVDKQPQPSTQDHLSQEPPMPSPPSSTDKSGAAADACAQPRPPTPASPRTGSTIQA
ncbi:hypothetical protein LV75_002057 [Actinokineospora diospyrosa]|uniref:Uncharacterized protein n=1 Tax=Actinokineospora diospyrosa TaxID=103728 RepID=A0ABT1IAH3_9PSEU|nr:hypothetical protein [Actinokineospora diospyrosa]